MVEEVVTNSGQKDSNTDMIDKYDIIIDMEEKAVEDLSTLYRT